MSIQSDLALLSAAAYWDIRSQDENQAPLPAGWRVLSKYDTAGSGDFGTILGSGFTARVFQSGTKIVIAFAGTEFGKSKAGFINDFLAGNVPLAIGLYAEQALKMAQLYEQVRKDFAGAEIVFTGHSLGGGLASVAGVWFNREAYVYAPAPFEDSVDLTQLAGVGPLVLKGVRDALGPTADPAFRNYNPLVDLAARESKVHAYTVEGEVLIRYINWLGRITGPGEQLLYRGLDSSLAPATLHSIDLHAAALLNPTFSAHMVAAPVILERLMDETLYGYAPTGNSHNVLLKMIQGEVGVRSSDGSLRTPANEMLTHFTADAGKLVGAGNALTLLARSAVASQMIEWYYWQSSGYSGAEFMQVDNAVLRYTTAVGAALPGAQNKSGAFVGDWIASYLPTELPAAQNSGFLPRVDYAKYHQWTVATSAATAAAQDPAKTQAFIGSPDGDAFTGGTLSDLLLGGGGNDTLDGGAGSDILYGGDGIDTYNFAGAFGGDVVVDADKQGAIAVDGVALTGGKSAGANTWIGKDASGRVFRYATVNDASSATGTKLVITREGAADDSITINNFVVADAKGSGFLGIHLDDTPRVALLQEAADDFWRDVETNVANLAGKATPLVEKIGTRFTLLLNTAAHAGDTFVIALDGLINGGLKAILGDQIVDAHGAVIQLAEGQTQVSFALVQDGDITDDMAGGIRVNYNGGEGRTAQSNTWGINLDAAEEGQGAVNGDFIAFTSNAPSDITRTGASGTFVVVPKGSPQFTIDNTGNLQRATSGIQVLDNAIYGTAGNDVINGLTGYDMLGGGAGTDRIDGGAGDDMIGGGAGNDILIGGEGNDFISSAGDPSKVGQQNGPSDRWGNWGLLPAGATLLASGGSWGAYRLDNTVYWSGMLPTGTTPQNDFVDAGLGDDHVIASWGDDRVLGGDGNDEIAGLGGGDVLEGEAGDDKILGDGVADANDLRNLPFDRHGADFLDGGSGNDTLEGGGGADDLFGGIGNDKLYGDTGLLATHPSYVPIQGHGGDYLDGEDGDDYLEGNGGSDTLYGGEGADSLWGDNSPTRYGATVWTQVNAWGNDYLDGETGKDTLVGGGGDDTLYGGDGDDFMATDRDAGGGRDQDDGEDYADGEAGKDTIIGGGGADLLYGGTEDDTLFGDDVQTKVAGDFHGDDYLDGEEGNDQLVGGGGSDTLWGGEGNDKLFGDDKEETLDPQHHGADFLYGEEGDDTLAGFGGDDLLVGGDGNDVLDGGAGADTLIGGAGSDVYGIDSPDDVIIEEDDAPAAGTMATATATATAMTMAVAATTPAVDQVEVAFDYTLGATIENLVLKGTGDLRGTGNDADNGLWGNAGRNTLTGGLGDDFLQANGGDDTYAYSRGDGIDTIDNFDFLRDLDQPTLPQALDTLRFGPDIAPQDVVAVRQNLDLVLRVSHTDDRIFLYRYFAAEERIGNKVFDRRIDAVTFDAAPDVTWDQARLQQMVDRAASNHLPRINAGAQSLSARAGDYFSLTLAPDLFKDDDGDPVTYRLTGSNQSPLPDWLFFDPETRTLSGTPPASAVGAQSLVVWGMDPWNGVYGINVFLNVKAPSIAPVVGTPLPDWSAAQDTAYQFQVATNFRDADGEPLSFFATLVDGSRLPDWLSFDPVTATFSGLAETDPGAVDVRVYAWDRSNLMAQDDFRFTITPPRLTGTPANDVLTGTRGNDLMEGGAGNDSVQGLKGNDTLRGGEGNDTLQGGAGDDLLEDAAGANMLYGGDGNDRIVASRESWVDAGAGNDTVEGSPYHVDLGTGDDLLLLGGTGSVALTDAARSSGVKTLQFGSGVRPEDVIVSRRANELHLSWGSNAADHDARPGQATVADFFVLPAGASTIQVSFADAPGTTWTGAELTARAHRATPYRDGIAGTAGADSIDGLAGNDELWGLDGNDTLLGGAGYDQLQGGNGDDRLDGGEGYNLLNGGAGDDTLSGGGELTGGTGRDTFLVFEAGSLVETRVYASANPAAGDAADTVILRNGVRPEDIMVLRPSSNDLDLVDLRTGSSVRLYGAVGSSSAPDAYEQILFEAAPGVAWTPATLRQMGNSGGEGSDLRQGYTQWANLLQGNAGDDTLVGSGFNDTLVGGTGNDLLRGGAGNDVYRFGAGSGRDEIYDNEGANVIELGSDIRPEDVRLVRTGLTGDGRSGESIVLVVQSTGAQLHIDYFFWNTNGSISEIRFADAAQTVWRFADITAGAVPTGSANALPATTGNDTYTVDHAGDTINEAVGGGRDIVNSTVSYVLPTNVEELVLLGDQAFVGVGNTGDNVLRGNALGNVLYGGGGQDTWYGGLGDDTFVHKSPSGVMFLAPTPNVVENAGEGYDTLVTDAWSLRMPENVERLMAQGPYEVWSFTRWDTDQSAFYGNALDNVIDLTGFDVSAVSPVLPVRIDGGAGADTMIGGKGSITYVVDNAGDRVVHTGPTVARVETSVSFTAGRGIGSVILTGTAAIAATGNDGDNVLDGLGNWSANRLEGRGGNDLYIIDSSDVVVEAEGGGYDTVRIMGSATAVSIDQWANIEAVELARDAGHIDLTGNDAANKLAGSFGVNTIDGRGGDDVVSSMNLEAAVQQRTTGYTPYGDHLIGGEGNDTVISYGGPDLLEGGAGDDLLQVIDSNLAQVDGGSGNDRIEASSWRPPGQETVRIALLFGTGAGHDTVTMARTRSQAQWDAGHLLLSTVRFWPDTDLSSLQVARESRDLLLRLGTQDSLRIVGYFADGTSTQSVSSLDAISFGDETIIDRDAIAAAVGRADLRTASAGDDIVFANGAGSFDAGAGNDRVFGRAIGDRLLGGVGDDSLYGAGGEDELVGGSGNDLLVGGRGADTYRFGLGWGNDRIDDLQWLTVDRGLATAQPDYNITDTVLFEPEIAPEDIVATREGNDVLLTHRTSGDSVRLGNFRGGPSADVEQIRFAKDGTTWNMAYVNRLVTQVVGSEGDDVLQAWYEGGLVNGLGGNDQVTGSEYDDELRGGAGNDTLGGGGGNDTLDGGPETDSLTGGSGDDTYVVDSTTDVLNEAANMGIDTVVTPLAWTLASNFENLTLTGSANVNGTGNAANNFLFGNSGDNTLDGLAGVDTMAGGRGNDTYVVDVAGDTVVEQAGEGIDLAKAGVTWTLPDNVENMTLTGTGGTTATGNALDNLLTGNGGANRLEGRDGNDTLDGGAGNDTLVGGAGNDRYIFGTGDAIVEDLDAGIDTIVTSATVTTLAANVENVELTGTSAINVTGNALNNLILGNGGANSLVGGAGNDTLDGGAGNDTLSGGLGDDTYVIGLGTDTISESASQGTDTVISSIAHTLAANFENLTLSGTGNINGTGNTAANVLAGNAGNNTLTGLAGNDTYLWGLGGGSDTIVDSDSTAGNLDRLVLGKDVRTTEVTLARSVDNLLVKLTGTTQQLTITNYFLGTANQVEEIQFADVPGFVLRRADVDACIAQGGAANRAPTAQPIAAQTATEDTAWSFTLPAGSFSDADGQALSYVASLANGDALPSWLQFNASTRTFSATPGSDKIGSSLQLRVTATDPGAASVSSVFTVNVVERIGLTTTAGGTVTGTAYRDTLTANAYGATLLGGAGRDTLAAVAQGSVFAVRFEGGTGNDTMTGSYAGDVYVYRPGDGDDRIHDDVGVLGADAKAFFAANPYTASYQDRLEFQGIDAAAVTRSRSGSDLVLTVAGGGSVTVEGWFDGSIASRIESLVFADATWSADEAEDGLVQAITQQAPGMLVGSSLGDSLTATGGGSRLYGYGGNDQLAALADGAVFDLTLFGGRGNDTLAGSYAGDTYLYHAGDGDDIIRDDVRSLGQGVADFFAANPDAASYQDHLRFGAGIAAADVARARVGDDLVLSVAGGSLRVEGWFDGTPFRKIEWIDFDDGSSWRPDDVEAGLPGLQRTGAGVLWGTGAADTFVANGYNTRLVGNGGDDNLSAVADGGVFDVQFDGGAGNDTLTGSYARDRYHFDRGDGNDVIRDDVRALSPDVAAFFSANPGTSTYQDELQFGAGIATTDVLRQRVGDDLVFSLADGSGSVRVEGWYDGTLLRKIEAITFASGSTWSAADAEQGLPGLVRSTGGTLWGTGAADQLTASGYGATLLGNGGNDSLLAVAAGNVFDVSFRGGKGDDSLTGSYARDFYYFDAGDGHDRIHDDVGALGPDVKAYFAANPTADTYQDHLVFGAGIAPGDVVRRKVGQDLELSFNGGADSVTIEGWFDGTIFRKIEVIGFANGTTWTAAVAEQGL